MKRWLQNFAHKLQVWMYGRYGYDELSKVLTISALVCIIFSIFAPILNSIALLLMIWSIYRTYSKNIVKRQKERDFYLKSVDKVKKFFKLRKNIWRDRKTHRYYKCPTCKSYLRVPKGRGEIEISCPKCKNKITRTT